MKVTLEEIQERFIDTNRENLSLHNQRMFSYEELKVYEKNNLDDLAEEYCTVNDAYVINNEEEDIHIIGEIDRYNGYIKERTKARIRIRTIYEMPTDKPKLRRMEKEIQWMRENRPHIFL